jgi:hypothetical protein
MIIIPSSATYNHSNSLNEDFMWYPIFKPYKSFIDISYKERYIEEPIPIDDVKYIPLTVNYSTDIPLIYLYIPFPINTLILFGRIHFPYQIIRMNIIDIPELIDIFFITRDIVTDIPFEKDGPYSGYTTLYIRPFIGATAQTYTINITASCNDVGRVKGTNISIPFTFTISDI